MVGTTATNNLLRRPQRRHALNWCRSAPSSRGAAAGIWVVGLKWLKGPTAGHVVMKLSETFSYPELGLQVPIRLVGSFRPYMRWVLCSDASSAAFTVWTDSTKLPESLSSHGRQWVPSRLSWRRRRRCLRLRRPAERSQRRSCGQCCCPGMQGHPLQDLRSVLEVAVGTLWPHTSTASAPVLHPFLCCCLPDRPLPASC